MGGLRLLGLLKGLGNGVGFPRALKARGKPQPAPTAKNQKNQESRFNPGRSEPKNHLGGGCSSGTHPHFRNPDYVARQRPTKQPKNSTSFR